MAEDVRFGVCRPMEPDGTRRRALDIVRFQTGASADGTLEPLRSWNRGMADVARGLDDAGVAALCGYDEVDEAGRRCFLAGFLAMSTLVARLCSTGCLMFEVGVEAHGGLVVGHSMREGCDVSVAFTFDGETVFTADVSGMWSAVLYVDGRASAVAAGGFDDVLERAREVAGYGRG